MKIIIAKNSGFCSGVKNAVNIALANAGEDVFTFGELIHNDIIINKLKVMGIQVIEDIDKITKGTVIIRSHGAAKDIFEKLRAKDIKIIDATCHFVSNIHKIVQSHYLDGFHIVIMGESNHPEVLGINGWCDYSATIINDYSGLETLKKYEKLCFVAQTTFSTQKYSNIIKKISKDQSKTVEIFDTICYTTSRRQNEAKNLARHCNAILVLGSRTSSNTTKLFEICKAICPRTFMVEKVSDIQNYNFNACDTIGIVTGASAPNELIMEVKGYMGQQFSEVQNEEFINGVEESLVSYKEGRRIKGTVISADEKGVHIRIGGKKDGLIYKDEASLDGSYNPSDFTEGMEIEAIITSKQDLESGCVLLSKKRVDQVKEGDKFVDTIRNGEIFDLNVEKETKGGLLGKIGTYTIFIPASHIKETFVKELKTFVGKKLRLTAIEIDDAKHKIVASQRKVLEKERKEREDIFWTHVQPNVVVNGKVKRVTNFGAFVSVDNFDCLAHIVDLSWNRIKSVEEVLTIGNSYDFLVLSVDKEKGRVSLGYKQLQAHPFVSAMEKYPIGTIVKGKVVSLVPFGAFVEIEPGIEGLVHVSEAAHNFVKNINEVVKVGDMVDVMILNIDEASRKITLSMKACTPEAENTQSDNFEQQASHNTYEKSEKKFGPRKTKPKAEDNDVSKEWSEDSSNNPFADLLKDLDIK